ncbi:hypothetical protein AB0M47_04725 [Hamadaea sp. NPDC051192]|uniref:hypothetical protein n=1 Tax=Hamadaea sp. NPDC051192 TaxID=3154940 RepID=UPI00343E88AA
MEVRVHVLDDLDGLSPRAQAFLDRGGRRAPDPKPRLPTDYVRLPDRSGRLIFAPTELIVRREGFANRFGGLRYAVRRSAVLNGQRVDTVRCWEFDLSDWICREPDGWSFGWTGERVSSPVRYLVHTDGRFGVTLGGGFLDVSPSLYHMIEAHALMDELADWYPLAESALEPWAASQDTEPDTDQTLALEPVPEASGPCDRWLRSDTLTVRVFDRWTDGRPRPTGVMAWTRYPPD